MINPIFFQGIVFIDYLVSCALKIITMMMMMIIPCTCIASSLLIYLISCWQSPPLTLVNEMRLLLGPQCLVAMVWVRFISCCLAIPRVSWLFFLSTLTTHCLKYNETEPGQSRITVPKRFLSSPTALLSWCLISVLRVEQGSAYKHGIYSHADLGSISGSGFGSMYPLAIHLEKMIWVSVSPWVKWGIITPSS